MKKRVYGIETEYGFVGSIRDSTYAKWLRNGGKLYVDGNHPEYCTPECSSPRDVVKYDKAGELIAQSEFSGSLYKNNVAENIEGKGLASFGCHENYLVHERPIYDLIPALIPFLVTRQIFTGAGGGLSHGKYLISPRAMHIDYDVGEGTQKGNRPIVNTRDKPYADPSRYRRLHLIHADANMSEVCTYLKIGTTSLVLDLLEEGRITPLVLANPVETLKSLSENVEGRWLVELEGGKRMKATDVQRVYLEAACRHIEFDETSKDIAERWGKALDSLDRDPEELSMWLEWIMKKNLLLGFAREENIPLDHARVKNLELQFTDISRKRSAFYFLQDRGLTERIVSDKEIREAVHSPPQDTRARFRGLVARTMPYGFIQWNEIRLKDGRNFLMPDPLDNYTRYEEEPGREAPKADREGLLRRLFGWIYRRRA